MPKRRNTPPQPGVTVVVPHGDALRPVIVTREIQHLRAVEAHKERTNSISDIWARNYPLDWVDRLRDYIRQGGRF